MGQETEKKPKKESKVIGVRASFSEYAELEAKASKLNLTVPSYLRKVGLDAPKTAARSAPNVDRKLFSEAIGQLGKIGNNVNQIARHLNEGSNASLNINSLTKQLRAVLDELLDAVEGHANDNQRKEPR